MPQLRQLTLISAEDVIAEVENLRRGPYERGGNWSLTQICEHLETTTKGGMEGFGFRAPWLLRKFLLGPVLHRIIAKGVMAPGFPTAKILKPKSLGGSGKVGEQLPEDDRLIDRFLERTRAAAAFEGPLKPHPLSDRMTVEEWKKLLWIHASLHLGFLKPVDSRL